MPARPKVSEQLGEHVSSLGEFIAAQRRSAELSLRQLAEQAGVSNPYLSQIERGLRKPSAEVLAQLAKALRVSAESLYVRAGILDPDDAAAPLDVVTVIASDQQLNPRQKQALVEVYSAFVQLNASGRPAEGQPASVPQTEQGS